MGADALVMKFRIAVHRTQNMTLHEGQNHLVCSLSMLDCLGPMD